MKSNEKEGCNVVITILWTKVRENDSLILKIRYIKKIRLISGGRVKKSYVTL